MDEITDENIDGHHAFGFELAQRNIERPLVGAGEAEAVTGQVDRFADTHAGVAEQQEDIEGVLLPPSRRGKKTTKPTITSEQFETDSGRNP